MVFSRPGPRTGEQPLAEIRTPPKKPLARPVHDPLAGLPPAGPPVRQIPPGRWPQGSLEWLLAISNVPSDPVGMPLGGAGGLVESGQLILFGGSLANAGTLAGPLPVTGATGAISAAGAGSAALGNGAAITAFEITFVSATTAAGTATVSNVAGGPYTFNIPSGTTLLTVPLSFAASSGSVAPTVTIAAAASASGGNVNVSGTLPAPAATAPGHINLYDGVDTKGTQIVSLDIPAGASVQLNIPRAGILCEIGLFAQVTAGTITGTIYVGHVWKYPFTPPGE